jgi:hypothetical protein
MLYLPANQDHRTVSDTPETEKLNPDSAARFAWSDGDVEWLDEDGKPVSARDAKEQQLIYARSQVAQDVAADTEQDPEGNRE